ncbi:hypothetical protein [Singulisphaera acidiphila]|uniref:Uncharacterized protein n=1 Tax=Singulisphaera acidiphila (strain ATCC BAA-1392 / DSM 18658 / VKM B-2454 / MOB10) TaxID=886293 RepID=L0DDG0_SINAD|nr:hypothetical protein [Singulisphaera acidiphila]AGA26711.1 hypothetical protein Sinac_2400 [Singulisphaera acidiphila DSM 18658]
MVTPKRAWSTLVRWWPRSEHSVLRLLTIGALVVSAFHLHDRANQLEQRERSLQQRMAAFSRQIQEQDERAGALGALPASLEKVVEATAESSSPLVDSEVRRADYRQTIRPVALKARD